MSKRRLPCGSWPTPVTAEVVASSARQPTAVAVDGTDVYWSELRPDQGGRTQVLRVDADGSCAELLGEEGNARTRVHEYGGGSWWVRDGVLWFTEWRDQQLRRRTPDGLVAVVSPDPDDADVRWADGDVHPVDGRLAVVRETHPHGRTDATAVRNEVVVLSEGAVEVVADGTDFVAAPRWSPDGSSLAWLEWDHPNMPWDGTVLKVRRADGTVHTVAGGEDEAVAQPRWAPDGSLWFCSDRSDWFTLYRWVPGSEPVQVVTEPGDVGRPAWAFGTSTYDFLDGDGVVLSVLHEGRTRVLHRLRDGTIKELARDLTWCPELRAQGHRVLLLGASATAPTAVLRLDTVSDELEQLSQSEPLPLPRESISEPQHLGFPGGDGHTSYVQFYPPRSDVAQAPDGELPPLVVILHGGPTSNAVPALNLSVQFWTTRGFAVADVDYGGSTGYGRAYRNRLRGQWGVLDVADCIAVTQWLGEQGLVDPRRCVIRGGSAGGFTTLMALATSAVFAAGCDLFGVADLEALARETHKFESRYLDRLVAPYPEGRQVYVDRSPLSHVGGLDAPLIVLQGSEDEVVPPAQSEAIVAALRERGVPVAYRLYPGEQHGFRRAENIVDALEAELSFYSQVLGFPLPDGEDIPTVAIEHLPH